MIDSTPAAIAARNGCSPARTSSVDDRQLQVRVRLGRAVPGEVLRARGHSLPLQAADERRHMARDELGVGAERADPDHRVRRVDVDVGDRGEVEVDPDGGEVGADRGRDALGQLDVVDGPERPVARIRAAAIDLEPGDVAALLVDPDQTGRAAAARSDAVSSAS